jgi:hypothetical protein
MLAPIMPGTSLQSQEVADRGGMSHGAQNFGFSSASFCLLLSPQIIGRPNLENNNPLFLPTMPMLKEPSQKYRPFPTVNLPNRQWPNKTLTKHPRWLVSTA